MAHRRTFWLLLVSVLAAACDRVGELRGTVQVGPGQTPGLAVMAVLWRQETVTDADGRNSTKSTTVAQVRVGTTPADGAASSFAYGFAGLPLGSYLTGAYLDVGADRSLTTDPFVVDDGPPAMLDGARPRAERNLYLQTNAPDRTSIRGVLHRSERAAAGPALVMALSGPINDARSQVVARQWLAEGTELAFELFNLQPGRVHLVAQAADSALPAPLVVYPFNPVRITEGQRPPEARLWMDRHGDGLGRLAGVVQLNGPLPAARVRLQALEASGTPEAPVLPSGAALEALVEVPADGRTQVPFEVPSLRPGAHFLSVTVETTEPDGRVLATQRYWGARGRPLPIRTTEAEAGALELPVGVARCSGALSVERVETPVAGATVFALSSQPPRAGQAFPDVITLDTVLLAEGAASGTFELFGLDDGAYRIAAVPDLDGDGSVTNEWLMGLLFEGAPAQVEVSGGERVRCDVRITLP